VGSSEYEIIEELRPEPDDLVVLKRSTSPFNSTGLDQILRNMGITVLVTVGVATDACVGLTARDAADRGYGVVLVEDATATYSPERQDAFLSFFASVHGNVMTTEEVLPYFAGESPVRAR
jgi:nicotinamidase-related amidase